MARDGDVTFGLAKPAKLIDSLDPFLSMVGPALSFDDLRAYAGTCIEFITDCDIACGRARRSSLKALRGTGVGTDDGLRARRPREASSDVVEIGD